AQSVTDLAGHGYNGRIVRVAAASAPAATVAKAVVPPLGSNRTAETVTLAAKVRPPMSTFDGWEPWLRLDGQSFVEIENTADLPCLQDSHTVEVWCQTISDFFDHTVISNLSDSGHQPRR